MKDKTDKMPQKPMNVVLYWVIQLTWGGLATIPGMLLMLLLMIVGKKFKKNGYGFLVEIGGNWGGFSMGPICLIGSYSTISPSYYEHIRRHEFGHSVQQLVLGPFQLLLVSLPSIVRYWYQTIRHWMHLDNAPYDQAIFEYTASKFGYAWVNAIEGADLPYEFKRK